MMKMERVEELTKYLGVLGSIKGSYHNEIKNTINEIEDELQINRKGSITINRPDGYAIINNDGIEVSGCIEVTPAYTTAKQFGNFYLVDSKNQLNLTRYVFNHEARFLTVDLTYKPANDYSNFEFYIETYLNDKVFTKVSYGIEASDLTTKNISIDLGKPNGKSKSVCLKAKSINGDNALIGINRVVLKG